MLRILLVTILAVLVPLQGMASVAAGQCMAVGHHQDAGMDHEHAHDADEHHAADHDEDGKSSHCEPCTACCASASIAGAVSLPILATPATMKHVLLERSARGFQPQGIDRPPLAL